MLVQVEDSFHMSVCYNIVSCSRPTLVDTIDVISMKYARLLCATLCELEQEIFLIY